MSKIIYSNPGPGLHTLQIVGALSSEGLLEKFITTIAVPGDSWIGKKGRSVPRRIEGLGNGHLQIYPWREVIRLLVSRLDKKGVVSDAVWEWAELGFDSQVRRLIDECDVFMGVEHACFESFGLAKESGKKCIYDVPSAYSPMVRELLDEEFKQFPELMTPYEVHIRRRDGRRQARRDAEMAMADLVLTYSSFSRDSYVRAGVDVKKIRVMALGAPDVSKDTLDDYEHRRLSSGEGDAVFLFAGNFSPHKGAHILLEAWNNIETSRARLLVAGKLLLPESLLRKAPSTVEFLGKIPWSNLQRLYRGCTALVFPTLSDAFGMVVTEAMAAGLPVITTPNAGASDLVEHGRNGLIVPVRDARALSDAMQFLIDDRNAAKTMRYEAVTTAAGRQWSHFRQDLVDSVRTLLHPEKRKSLSQGDESFKS
jgi:glycosyltransferase involved in cell wall biosynthesis